MEKMKSVGANSQSHEVLRSIHRQLTCCETRVKRGARLASAVTSRQAPRDLVSDAHQPVQQPNLFDSSFAAGQNWWFPGKPYCARVKCNHYLLPSCTSDVTSSLSRLPWLPACYAIFAPGGVSAPVFQSWKEQSRAFPGENSESDQHRSPAFREDEQRKRQRIQEQIADLADVVDAARATFHRALTCSPPFGILVNMASVQNSFHLLEVDGSALGSTGFAETKNRRKRNKSRSKQQALTEVSPSEIVEPEANVEDTSSLTKVDDNAVAEIIPAVAEVAGVREEVNGEGNEHGHSGDEGLEIEAAARAYCHDPSRRVQLWYDWIGRARRDPCWKQVTLVSNSVCLSSQE